MVALVLPIVIVLSSLAGLEKFRTFADEREDKNAGKVINGRVISVGVPAMIERRLEKFQPDVVILGNSLSNTDLSPQLMAKRLGIPVSKVQKFSIPNSMGAHWYAIIKNRIYLNGHRPKIVLILSDLQSLLALSPRSEASHLNLTVHLGEDEPVIDGLLGHRYYYLERVRENRGKLREMAIMSVRNAMVGLFVPPGIAPTGDKQIDAALERVFDASRVDMRLHSNAILIYNTQNDKDLLPFDPASLPMPEDSFLPEMAELVQQNDGHLVYLRPPMSPLLPDEVGDIVPADREAAVYPLMDQFNGTFLDLREVEMDVTHFQNPDHMNPEGARRFTEIVTELLLDVGGGSPTAELLKTVGLVDGRYASLPLEVAFKDPPRDLPRSDRPFAKGRGKMLYFATDLFGFLNDTATGLVSPHASRCSPLRVLEDGVMLPHPNESCDDVQRQGRGRTCHTPDRLFFTTSDNTNPYLNEREYRITLDPERTCDGGLWLYPGDKARITARPYDLAAISRGAGALTVLGVDMGAVRQEGGVDQVVLRLKAGNQLRADATVTVKDLTTTGVRLDLEPRISAAAQSVVVEVENLSDRFLLLTSLRLGDGGEGG